MDLNEFHENNSSNYTLESSIPPVTKVEKCLLGIDEAGRGPVLGPMVYGIAFCPVSFAEKLKEMGFADSKTLSEEMREKLFSNLNSESKFIGWKAEILSPNYISNSMLKRGKYNLNALSHDSAIGLVQKALDDGVNLSEVFVDTVGDPKKYEAKLSSIFPNINFTVAKKADATYPIVSAASICAKVARDRVVKGWKFMEGESFNEVKFGSGYPADPTTKSFMADNVDKVFGYPQFVRFSWSTSETILQKQAISVTWSDEEDDENTPSILSFFGKNSKRSSIKKPAKSHQFYKERGLHHVSSIH
ncbi:Ribonuclease H2 subunit A [Nymphon striatum]|nr:Ribonuclease H2 subunit A [Nymphon striatum]KAG1662863.1 Ribonuclease H2 subunit A [Nymphon striatum]